ncbi:hypothetical protein D3OALGA1CA_913 [Olavius algarvensis associated proteobacterium Delta 3]|nr:hypothetical protein D3OALGA1CA_913 [Olavius algarvensis associated proteobacterium Delta 3]CAB5129169.1 hypothetical protein D3OALGB2SA_3500 [Olavius algarvensis associated proteobacterium Delta 3]
MAFTLWPNVILLVCVGIIASMIGFIIYGAIVGFDNTVTDEEAEECQK